MSVKLDRERCICGGAFLEPWDVSRPGVVKLTCGRCQRVTRFEHTPAGYRRAGTLRVKTGAKARR